MRENRMLISIICASVALLAIAAAVVVFRSQIHDFFIDVKDKIDEKRCGRRAEYPDYAEM